MNVVICTLCLNEMEWLPKLYEQHRSWPGISRWVFVESADRVYADTNPQRVSRDGLSVDGTSDYLLHLGNMDSRIYYIRHGFSSHSDKAQGKCEARNRYLEVCHSIKPKPNYVIILDADEFYTTKDQAGIERLMYSASGYALGIVLKQRHIWYPPSLSQYAACSDPTRHQIEVFKREVVGGYWSVPHCRIWKYVPGMKYTNNHNTPDHPRGGSFREHMLRYDKMPEIRGADHPACIHMGYASSIDARAPKHRYYIARGEGVTDRRQSYVNCRSAFETWKEGDTLPHGARVIEYTGPVPECFIVDRGTSPCPVA